MSAPNGQKFRNIRWNVMHRHAVARQLKSSGQATCFTYETQRRRLQSTDAPVMSTTSRQRPTSSRKYSPKASGEPFLGTSTP